MKFIAIRSMLREQAAISAEAFENWMQRINRSLRVNDCRKKESWKPSVHKLCTLGPLYLTAITYHRDRDSQGFPELHRDTRDAGRTAGKARKAIEEDIGHSVVSQENYLDTAGTRQQKRIKQSKKSEASEQGQPLLFDDPIDEE
jgi:hypothetical protein